MNHRIETAIQFTRQIGKGNLTALYPEEFASAILEKELLSMQQQLLQVQTSESRKWQSAQNMTQLNECIRLNLYAPAQLYKHIIALLVKCTNAQTGIMYLSNTDNTNTPSISPVSTFGVCGKNKLPDKIYFNEGFSGQCFYEKRSIHITNVPGGYSMFSSALGSGNPSELYIFPLLYIDQVIGVIEIQTFQNSNPFIQISLMQPVCK
jgi:hypothetical protein